MMDTMTVKRVFKRLLYAYSGEMLLYLLLLMQVHTSLCQGTEGFFNSSSYASINSKFDPRARTSLSFRTCASGQLLYQEGLTGDYINLVLLPSGVLEFSWQVNSRQHSVQVGSNLISNHWYDVDILHKLGSVTLSVSGNSTVVANSTHTNEIFDINLDQSNPQMVVGRGFIGCVLQGAGVVLNDSSVHSVGVSWGKCPLPNKKDCDGYLVDHCFSQPCHMHSKCVSLPDGYRCECTLRYTGQNCKQDLGPLCNTLEYNQCQNGGTCQEDRAGNFTTCACPARFTGPNCEIMVDNTFCDFMPCRNGGTCNVNQFRNNYVCTCPQGFAGTDCELNIDECQSSPCQNNGTCTDEINAYTCDCTGTGYRGPNCEENINECEENNPCYTGSKCFDRYGGYICSCPLGFGGINCDQEVNDCDSSPCQNMGTCSDKVSGYLCDCVPGFAGKNCEENIDDCHRVTCPANSHCVDGINSYSCTCNPGYSGAVPHCQEIDECAVVPCLNGATCHDQLNGFTCTCADGFLGRHCEINIDECESQPCQNGATCVDGAGNYTCECVAGFIGLDCEIDIDECESNPCKNSAPCTNMVNDFFCDCLPGWEGKTCNQNIDECLSQPCMHGQCVDFLNNFTCNCDPGFSGILCDININECESSPCFNGGTCTDLINDFSCQCPENFMGKNCLEVYNACSSLPCQNGATCRTNIPSHVYTCICPIGFEGEQCEINIDDCAGVDCPSGKICVDLQNDYECRCPIGFSGDNCSINIDECSSNPCINGTCIDGIGAYACECPVGLTGKHCESDIDECSNSPCVHGICQNMFGSYLCYCTPGYTGKSCDKEFNECLSMPCRNNAVCNDLVNDYNCTCVPGFAGRNCETDINECASDPCLNGATCFDQINKYECSCIEGFSGMNCEINIDECASQPCLNNGICVDLINEFNCNCSDTGFTGLFCEINIDECASNPCQNGAWCEDLIKDYKCHCHPGYNGKNCEVDIEECASFPCLNSALCLENSNQTLYEMNYLGFFPAFSYETASGYRCICSSGFTGENCETNIDDCEYNDCKNGICIDAINDYYCACHLGYDGQHCGREINECQMLEPCENGATCIDLIADYKCECLPEFGGKTCQTRLIGCQDIVCENGATCIPLLDDNDFHSYTCQCMPGYHGKLCGNATTFSFNSTDSVAITHYNDLLDDFNLKFHFRTTLSDGLISSGYVPSSMLTYLLYLWNGMIKVDIYNGTTRVTELFSKGGQNDSHWKMVQLNFEPTKVSLNVSGWNVFKPLNFTSLNFSVRFGHSEHFPNAFMRDDIEQIPGFIGCVQDISVNGDFIIPNQNSELFGAMEGCNRKEQCEGSPCHNGFCKDNWLSYECICSRPYFGAACEYSYEAATFGYRNENSRAELIIPSKDRLELSFEFDVSFFLRTRNQPGVVFYLGSSLNGSSDCHTGEQNISFLLVHLLMGKLQVVLTTENGDIKELNHGKQVDTGDNYFIRISKNMSSISLTINDTSVSSLLTSSSSVCQEVLYIGGLPEISRQKRQVYSEHPLNNKLDILLLEDVAFFKGIVHDFRINDKEVVFYEIIGHGVGFPEVFGKAALIDVRKGVVSDDPCNILMPCLHDSECRDIWNEYVCICPDDYRGKNCQEKKPCAENHCPMDSECRNLDIGYECVASASFNGKQSRIQYQVENVNQNVTNITLSFRSMSSGTILWLESRQKSISNHFLHIEIIHGTLEVKWDLGPSYENLALHKTVSQKYAADNGGWHDVEIWFDGNLVHLKVSGNPENLSEDNYAVGLSELLNEGANVYLGYKPDSTENSFKGCMRDVRIGGMLLSFFDSTVFQDLNNPFHLVEQNIEIGCILCWDEDCLHGKCNNYTESYSCDCDEGYEGQTCDVDLCFSKNPCMNGGSCYHVLQEHGLMCSCPKEFAGSTCSEINHCESMPCLNGGLCSLEADTYKCNCSDYFEGPNCQQRRILDCNTVQCQHGTCLNIDVEDVNKFKCMCYDGYDGLLCDKIRNFCGSNPCQNNGSCTVYEGHKFAAYQCNCMSGFTGTHCEINVDECESNPCLHGKCIDGINEVFCDCYPGYEGQLCQHRIKNCTATTCFNGECISDPSTNSYKCKCKEGYIGSHCSVFNECDDLKCSGQGDCEPSFDDHELTFIHKCNCKDGYSGTDCTTKLAISGNEDDTKLVLMILIPVLSLFLLCLLIGSVVFLRVAKKKRATRGTYSPSRQEMFGSRVEMNHVMKPPPEERLI